MKRAGEHQPRHHAGDEQPADRGLGRDAVEDEGDRRRNEDAERAARADRAGRDVVGIAAPAHLRDAHLADGGAAGRRGARERGEDRAGAEVGDHEPAGQPVEPAVERLVQVLAGGRRADRRAHHHEHRDRDQREVVQPRPEGLGDDVQRVEALEDDEEGDAIRAEPEGHRDARDEHQQRDDEDDRACMPGLMALSEGFLGLRADNVFAVCVSEMPKGGARPVTSAKQLDHVLQDQQGRARSASRGTGIQSRARHTVLERQFSAIGLVPVDSCRARRARRRRPTQRGW